MFISILAEGMTIGEGIAVCGALASVVALIIYLVKGKKSTPDLTELRKLNELIIKACKAVESCTLSDVDLQQRKDAMSVLAASSETVAKKLSETHRRFEDIIRMTAEVAHVKETCDTLNRRFDKLYDLTQEVLTVSKHKNNH